MIDRVVCVGGPPGSGKSTAARRVAEHLKIEYHSAGELFRAEAARHQMDLLAFSKYAESHDEIDRGVDRQMLEWAQPGRILDARLPGPLCQQRSVPAHRFIVTASPDIRAARLAQRDGVTFDRARLDMRAREDSERIRYRRLYQIDLEKESGDLVLDSSHRTPDQVVSELLAYLIRPPHNSAP